MLGDIQVPGSPDQAATLQVLATRAAVYATRARGDGTRRTYRSAWRASLGRPPLVGDPETVAMYAVHAADRGLSLSSLRWPPSRPPTASPVPPSTSAAPA